MNDKLFLILCGYYLLRVPQSGLMAPILHWKLFQHYKLKSLRANTSATSFLAICHKVKSYLREPCKTCILLTTTCVNETYAVQRSCPMPVGLWRKILISRKKNNALSAQQIPFSLVGTQILRSRLMNPSVAYALEMLSLNASRESALAESFMQVDGILRNERMTCRKSCEARYNFFSLPVSRTSFA